MSPSQEPPGQIENLVRFGVTPMPWTLRPRGVQLVMVAEACLATWPGPDDRCATSHAPAVAAPARPSSSATRMRSWASGEADSRSVSPGSATLSTPVEAAPKATRRGAAPAEFGLIQRKEAAQLGPAAVPGDGTPQLLHGRSWRSGAAALPRTPSPRRGARLELARNGPSASGTALTEPSEGVHDLYTSPYGSMQAFTAR